MNRFLREPLLHFALIGGLFFTLYQWRNPKPEADPTVDNTILVTSNRVAALAGSFARIWQRPPSPEELAGLITDHVTEEVYYREALRLGLDRDDVIIRRRLRQKMEFLSNDTAPLAEPTEAELAAFLKAHAEAFQLDAVLSFKQVYLNPDRHADSLEADTQELLALLKRKGAEADPVGLGDRTLLDTVMVEATHLEISRLFGSVFADQLLKLPVGEWQAPVESSFGRHIVLVTGRTDGRMPELEEVREAVQREWAADQRARSNEAMLDALRSRYTITIEAPAATPQPE